MKIDKLALIDIRALDKVPRALDGGGQEVRNSNVVLVDIERDICAGIGTITDLWTLVVTKYAGAGVCVRIVAPTTRLQLKT